jgi:hypothetical protein
MMILKYRVTMSDEVARIGTLTIYDFYASLGNINASINGTIKAYSFGTTFKLGEYHPPSDKPWLTYSGRTSGNNITFYTMGTAYIHQMNIYHEFGHLVNNHFTDPFTKSDFSENTPSWVDNGYISGSLSTNIDIRIIQMFAIQTESGGSEIKALFRTLLLEILILVILMAQNRYV